MYTENMITDIEHYEEIKKKRKLTDKEVIAGVRDMGFTLNDNFFWLWRKGKNPRIDTLKKITEYLTKEEEF